VTDAGARFVMPDLLAAPPVESIESVLSSLVELGADRDQIEIVPVGIFRRYRGVLLGYSPAHGIAVREGACVTLYVAERGLADRLPEGFLRDLPDESRPERVFDGEHGGFAPHGSESLPDGGPGRDLDPYEMARRQLDGGRKLLWMLDRALRRARRDVALHHHALWAACADPEMARRMLGLLDLEALDVNDTAAVFAADSLAGLQEAVGTLEEVAAFMTRLFDVPVRAEEEAAGWIAIPDALRTCLGRDRARLGRDVVAGVRMRDARPGIVFHVGPLSAEAAGRRHLDREGHQALEAAIAALTPAGRPRRIVYDIVPEERALRPGSIAQGLLGQTTYLKEPVRSRSAA
jgi:hypothetical protein